MSLPEDLKAELERALEEAKTDAPYYSVTEIVREQVQPILERLVADVKHWTQLYEEAANRRIEESKKLADSEALLARRPHLFLQEGFGVREVEMQGTLHDPEKCARLGGACAK